MLVDHRTLSLDQALEVIQTAAEVKVEVAAAAGESTARRNESLALLAKMAGSFECDRV
jgi:glutaminase